MSVHVELHIDGEIFPLKKFKWGFSQGTNYDGNPSNKIRQKMMLFSLDMIRDELFEAWAYANFMKKDFEVHIIPNILGGGRTRVIRAFEAFLVEFTTEYHRQSKEQTTYHCKVTAGRYETNTSTAVYRENWAQEPLPEDTVVHSSQEDEEPTIIECYYTDLNGNKIETPKTGEEIYLFLKTKNLVNKIIDIDLADQHRDFIYQGTRLENDILKDIKITVEEQKVKLKVVSPQPIFVDL